MMHKKSLCLSFLFCVFLQTKAQDTVAIKIDTSFVYKDYSASWDSMVRAKQALYPKDSFALSLSNLITGRELRNHLTELCSDLFEGRETGYAGQKVAEQYLVSKLKSFGLTPAGDNKGFTQNFNLIEDTLKRAFMEVGGLHFEHYKDFYSYMSFTESDSVEASKIYFAGYGIDDPKYSDYKGLDARGNILMIHQGEPEINDSTYLLSKDSNPSNWSNKWETKMKAATEHGVRTLLIVVKDTKEEIAANYRINSRPMHFENDTSERSNYCNVFYVTRETAIAIFKKAGKDYDKFEKKLMASSTPKGLQLKLNTKIIYNEASIKRVSSNVAGLIEGSDKKNEYVVYSAHYDHLGKHNGLIYRGADDDGSGTSGILEIAQSYAEAKKAGKGPRRSILILFFSGEEKGLLGSEYYSKNPLVPNENTVVDLNIDMIGRVDAAHENNPNYVYIIGDDKLSSELRGISEKANKTYHEMELNYKYNVESEPNRYYYRSDHYNFAKKGIPIIFYFNGSHKDYHKPSDTIDKINFGKLMFSARLAFFTGWEIANREARLKVDKK